MQLNYQTVTVDKLPSNDQLTIDDYFITAQDHHKATDTFVNGEWVGKKVLLSDILTFVRNNVPYIYNTVYKYDSDTLSTQEFTNIVGFKLLSKYMTAVKDVGNNLLNIDIVLPQNLYTTSDVLFNSIITNSINVNTLSVSSVIDGISKSTLKLNTPVTVTLTGDANTSFTFDGTSSSVVANINVNDNTHKHNNTTLDDISWTKVSDKPSPHVDVALTGPIVGSSFFDLTLLNGDAMSIATSITPGAVDLITHTTGNYLNSIAASGNGLSIAGSPNHNGVQTVVINSQSSNVPDTIVLRDALGDINVHYLYCTNMIGNSFGNLVGNVTGNVTGTSTGNTYGLHTGNVIGDITGNVTGNLVGNVTGNLLGNVTGNLTGNVTGNITGTAGSLATGYTIGCTGDISFTTGSFNGTANVTGVSTLSNTGVVPGTYNNDPISVRPFTVDAKGRITSVGAAVPINYTWASLSGTPTTISGYGITDTYNKTYIDSIALGMKPKMEAKVATITSITLSGAQTIDGKSIVAGDRVLVMSQSASAQNGIYIAATGTWTRAIDANTSALLNGALVSVASGTVNANKVFYQTNTITTLDTDAVNFAVFTSIGAYSPVITGAASTTVSSNLTASKVLISDASGKIATATASSTELGYLVGVTSNIQTQFSAKADQTALTLHSTTTNGHGTTSAIVGINDIQTLTNKTFNLLNNNLLGTLAQFNAALTDADFSTQTGTETLSNKTLLSSTLYSPTITGGSVKNINVINSNIYSPVITGGNISYSTLTNTTLITPTITGGTYNNSTFNTSAFNSCTFNLAVLNSPTLYTPNIGIATGQSFNDITGLGNADPVMDSVADPGVSSLVSKQDHRHPSDTSRSPFHGPGVGEGFIVGELYASENSYVKSSSTDYDARFSVIQTNNNMNSFFSSQIGTILTESFWSFGSVYDNGNYFYRLLNENNNYIAIQVNNATGKLLFGTSADNNTNSKAQFNGNIDVTGIKFENYLNGCYITNRTISDYVNELILFNSYNSGNLGQITLRAPRLRFQTFNEQSVTSVDNNAGINDRIVIDEDGTVFINEQPEDDVITSDTLKVNGSIKGNGFTQNIVKTTLQIYNVSETDYTILTSYSPSGEQQIILPDVSLNKGRILNIKRLTSPMFDIDLPYKQVNNVIIKPLNVNTLIDDAKFIILKSRNETITLQSDGSVWYII